MRALALLACALLLAGCNVVLSEKPLFHAADAALAPPFRDGAWVSLSAKCLAEWTDPASDPPQCAEHAEVRDGRLIPPEDDQTVVVAGGGDPLIVQIPFTEKDVQSGKPFTVHIFGALKPVRRDEQGRVTEVRRWLVLCGPPPLIPKDTSLRREEYLTEHPLPGMRVDRKLGACFARDAQAVRDAARASEAWDEDHALVRWWREKR